MECRNESARAKLGVVGQLPLNSASISGGYVFQLTLLGGATVQDETGATARPLSRRHPLALLALLVTVPSRTLSRGKLVGLLWPDSPEETARNRLNTYVHVVRKVVGEEVLVSVGDDLRLDRTMLTCDVCEFEEALEADDYERAIDLYSGPFLDGFRLGGSPAFEQRVDQERARLQHGYYGALEALAERAEGRDDPELAAYWWRERANQDPYDSRVTRRLMVVLVKTGNRAGALRVAHEHARLLEEEFGTQPSLELRALVQALEDSPAGDATEAKAAATFEPASLRTVDDVSSGKRDRADERLAGPSLSRQAGAGSHRSAWKTPLLGLVAIGLAGVAAVGVWYLLGAGDSAEAGVGDRSIAVLPFQTLGGEEATVFTEGLHSDVFTRLSSISGLEVISRESAIQLQEVDRPLPEMARELGVSWILAADVQTARGQVRVNARLVNALRDRQVWAEGYQRALTAENIFAIQGEITKAIVAALELELTPEEERRLESIPTRNTAAYELYLQAKDLDTTRAVGGHDRKVKLYQRALELDSAFAEAWAGLADAYVERAWGSPTERWADSGLAAARTAIALDPGLADAYAQMGDALWTLAGDSDEWLFAYRKALELQPSNREALNNLGTMLFYRGRQAEALKWIERGPRLSPTSPAPLRKLVIYNAELGRDGVANAWLEYGRARGHPLVDAELLVELFQRGNVDGARELIEELSEWEEDYVIRRRRGALALYENDWSEARRHYRALYPGVGRAAHPTFQGLLWDPLGLAYALDRLGYREEAREIAGEVVAATERELETSNQHFFTPWNRLAVARLILGDTTAALDLLEKAVDVGYRDVRTMRTVPTLSPLRDDPRFQVLLERMDHRVAEERQRAEAEGWGDSR